MYPSFLKLLSLILIAFYFISTYSHSDHLHEHQHEHDHHDHDHHDHDHDHHHHINEPVGPPSNHNKEECASSKQEELSLMELFIPPSKRESFWQGILATVFIGCAPILCIKFVSTKDYYLKILLAFAAGGLMGDVFLHLLPAALVIYQHVDETHHDHDHDDHHEHHEHNEHHGHSHNEGFTLLGQHILIGFGIFLVLEKLFHEFGHSHSDQHNDGKHDDHKHDEARKHAITLLSICADASHNFTDGLTIAASFLFSYKMGMVQTFAVLLHEIPHEIGDYAILLENGVSVKMAMIIQFLTAIACLIGTIIGFVLENTEIGTKWILPFTAGGFLYISCVQVLPTLVEKKYGKLQSLLHILFFIFGIGLMIFVGYVEENAETLIDFYKLS